MLEYQYNNWFRYSPELKKQIRIIVVDDGSIAPIESKSLYGIDLELFRVEEDIGWNNGGAKNLGMTQCITDWAFLCDLDHVLTNDNLEKLLKIERNNNCYYTFDRYDIDKKCSLVKAQNIFLINKDVFWSVGGYDEDFSGNYGYEDNWLKYNLVKKVKEITPEGITIEVVTTGDACTSNPFKKDIEINRKLLSKKMSGEIKSSSSKLKFRWKKV
jgi:predicted glycosyltransferase involved in capsule biosynthesis